MKALEPVLKFHFWILLGLGLILAIAGWWMTTSSMQASTATLRGEIDKADKDKNVGEVPSDDWAQNLAAINVDQKVLVDRTREKLYALQKERMVWPEVIAEAASKLKYREDFKDPILHTNYRDDYYKEVERVYKIPKPIDPVEDTGIVFFPSSTMPNKEWGDHTPTSQQMWDSMEDLWLLEPLLQAIYETNGGETAQRHDAIIVAIEYIGLKGGDRSKIGQSAEPMGGPDGVMGAGAMGPGGMGEMKPAGDRGGALGAGGNEGGSIGTDIKESEELGDPGTPTDQGGRLGAGAGPMAGAGRPDMEDIKGGGMGGGFNDPDAGRRWIDAPEEGLPYRTRGFKLTVLMDHRKVPDLYAQLTSSERSPWPVQILRMNVARLSDSGAFTPGLAGGAGPDAGFGAGPAGFAPGGGVPGGFGPEGGGFGPAAGAGAGGFRPGAGAGALPRRRRPGADFDDVRPGAGPGGRTPASNDQMANPYLARVTVVGLITLYNEPPPAESTGGAPAGEPSANETPSPTAAAEPAPAEEMPEGEPQPTAETDDPEKPAPTADDPATTDDQPEKKPAGDDEPSDSDTEKPKAEEPDTEKPKAEESDTEKPSDEKPGEPATESKPE